MVFNRMKSNEFLKSNEKLLSQEKEINKLQEINNILNNNLEDKNQKIINLETKFETLTESYSNLEKEYNDNLMILNNFKELEQNRNLNLNMNNNFIEEINEKDKDIFENQINELNKEILYYKDLLRYFSRKSIKLFIILR